jgi:natural product biosynthesis luciferase-like monooxygenase protein
MQSKMNGPSERVADAAGLATLIDLLRYRAAEQAQRLAYSFLADDGQERRLTYGEMDAGARAVGAQLVALGAAGQHVLLLYPPGLDYLIAFFGCLYAGAIAIPVYPPKANRSLQRLEAIVEDAGAVVAMTVRQIHSRRLAAFNDSISLRPLQWLVTDSMEAESAASWTAPPLHSGSLAMLQYTSGSTGTPRGVMLTHANLLHNSALLRQAFAYSEESHCVSWLPVYHDMGLIGGILQPLHGGFPCTLMSPMTFLQRPVRWLEAISQYRASISGAPNFAYDLCVRKVTEQEKATLDLSCWQVAFNGAEPVRADTLSRFAEAFRECGFRRQTFFPCYGLAEATLMVTGGPGGRLPVIRTISAKALGENRIAEPAQSQDSGRAVVSCGQPLCQQRVVIVDPDTARALPAGHIGEIWVAGESVAQGYWRKPEETQTTFGARLAETGEGPFLRTGDLGFLEEDELFVTGRLKDLIIVRGLNHYPQDLELAAQRSHTALRPGCGAAFSVALDGQERLAIVQEIDTHGGLDLSAAMESIRRTIAEEFELQAEIIALIKPGTIPKTSSGKIQRYACRDELLADRLETVAEWRIATPAGSDRAPQAAQLRGDEALEDWLRAQVAAKLKEHPTAIDLDRPLSSYGLDSLAAIELMHDIESALGVHLSAGSLLDAPSIAGLAEEIRCRIPGDNAAARDDQHQGDSMLSRNQQALWYLHQLDPESAAYNIGACVRIKGKLDVAALEATFAALVERHAALRTTYTAQTAGPIARVLDAAPLCFERVEAVAWDTDDWKDRLAEDARRPFNLEQGPLLRITLLERTAEDYILLLMLHHIACDFWSLSILVQEMDLIYAARREGRRLELPPSSARYADYIRWQETLLAGPEGDRLWRFWEEQLAGELSILDLPTDRPRPSAQTFTGASHPFHVSAPIAEGLQALARESGTTLYVTLLTIFQALLYRHTGQTDLLIGSLATGRSRAEFAGLVGYLVNPVVIRADLADNPELEELLAKNRAAVRAVLDHQDYPFPLLVERLQPARDPSRSPIFQVMFVLQKPPLLGDQGLAAFALNEEGARMRLGSFEMESLALNHRVAQFDLTVAMVESQAGLAGSIQYNSDLFDPETIAEIAERFVTMIEGSLARPRQKVADLPFLPAAEQQQVLCGWNDTQVEFDSERCVHQWFEEQVGIDGAATALVFEAQRFSYGELNARANQLAHYLRQLGVGPESRVALCVERSPEMVIGILGVLKAGGAYVPLDPAFPAERLRYMLGDSQAEVLLTQRRIASRVALGCKETVLLDVWGEELDRQPVTTPETRITADHLAYVIYTSGSSGRPKGVMISHRNVGNFFAGMDEKIGCAGGDTLLAVTSMSFDISVLELLWTLANGCRVVLLSEHAITGLGHKAKRRAAKPLDFSLFYFAAEDSRGARSPYRLLFEGSRFADANGFTAVWTPERHFHAFGGLYPNPSVTSTALAAMTRRVAIRAGSVVLPLHHPLRVAEEWSVVDNISEGRVGIAFASGWHADDFVFFPENYEGRKDKMLEGIETVRRLWRGESLTVSGGAGNQIEVAIHPQPVQPELPIWLTAAGSPDTFTRAGELGAGVLTHLLGQSLPELTQRIELYRSALSRAANPQNGSLVLMLHTYIGDSRDQVRERVRGPFTDYLRTSVGLIGNLIKSLNLPLDLNNMKPKDMEDLLAYAFDRYYQSSALFGTPPSCAALIQQVKEMGVDEVACLIDFGMDADVVLASLKHLNELKDRSNAESATADYSLAAQVRRYQPTLMQCTPSLMRMLTLNPEVMQSLASLKLLLLGGEALPPALATQVRVTLPARLINMYGPTETTIWSATSEVADTAATVPIGRPMANTEIYLLDRRLQPVARGGVGEIFIGGTGVARGYVNRPELTADRFVPSPFNARSGGRLYRTGDLGRHLKDGRIEYLGRMDYQVKIRGYRVETEEIEAVLCAHAGVREAVVLAREDTPGDKRLVAYAVAQPAAPVTSGDLRRYLKERLPDYMVPSAFVMMPSFPQTSNAKVDRKALPAPDGIRLETGTPFAPPKGGLEQTIAGVWKSVLKLERVGVHDNFFDIGGHSLLMAQVHGQLHELLHADLPLIKMLEHPTISSLARYLGESSAGPSATTRNAERAEKQRQVLTLRGKQKRRGAAE